MRRSATVPWALVLLLAGCSQQSTPPEAAQSAKPTTAAASTPAAQAAAAQPAATQAATQAPGDVVLAWGAAARAKDVAKFKSYMSPEYVAKFDAEKPDIQQGSLEAMGMYQKLGKVSQNGDAAEVTVEARAPFDPITLKLVSTGGVWKIAGQK